MTEHDDIKLHWSFDYRSHQNDMNIFGDALRGSLERYLKCAPPVAGLKATYKRYTVLPNYWRGYLNRETALETAGSVAISRKQRDGYDDISVEFENKYISQHTAFKYKENGRLIGDFSVDIKSEGLNSFKGILYQGRIDGGTLTVKETGGRTVLKKDAPAPILPEWSLLDRWSLLNGIRPDRFDLYEGMQTVCGNMSARELEDWYFKGKYFKGFCVAGDGYPMAYWWVDEYGQTIIAAKTFYTYVLTECGEGE